MIDGQLHFEGTIYTNRGKKIANGRIDTCKYFSRYETMVLKPNGIDIECKYADTIAEAKEQFDSLVRQYTVLNVPVKPIEQALTGKYAKLRDDLIEAVKAGREADTGEDGGTCNFDAPSIIAPRWIEKKVQQAAKEAGISAWKWNSFGATKYVFSTPTSGQANRRSRVSEAMCNVLKNKGYEVIEYCALD